MQQLFLNFESKFLLKIFCPKKGELERNLGYNTRNVYFICVLLNDTVASSD
jgi:hypothetical protein